MHSSKTTDKAQATVSDLRAQRLTIDGRRLKQLVEAGYLWLRANEAAVNAYNVYPVPDGDTGTNMMHTMRSAWTAIAESNERNLGLVAKAVSNGALRGSRGNSGIILSQLWRGLAKSLDGREAADAQDFAAALREASVTAYKGVSTPVEGTMLTVSRETADVAEYTVKNTHDLRSFLDAVTQAAYDSTQRTPTLLKILKEAGVVDSGGYGIYIILDGMRRLVHGQKFESSDAAVPVVQARVGTAPTDVEAGYGYDVQFLIYAPANTQLDVARIRAEIEAMGECPLVLGDEAIVKVHVHVPDPGVAISYGAKLGSLRDVVVEDMQAQSEGFIPGHAKPSQSEFPEAEIAIVAVASGDGIERAFRDIGVRVVVQGGQTMNPSVEDLLHAAQRANARNVLLLPNNGNIVMAANHAAELAEFPVKVVPTKTIPQGIGAALSFNFEKDLAHNAEAMLAAARRIITGEITKSTRTVTVNDVSVADGQTIGLIDDKLAVAGSDVASTLLALLEKAESRKHELITLYFGNGMGETEAGAIADLVRAAFPDQIVELFAGRQPHYDFVIGVE